MARMASQPHTVVRPSSDRVAASPLQHATSLACRTAGAALLLAAPFALLAQGSPRDAVFSDWTEPGGSTIHIEQCGKEVCAQLTGLARAVPTRVDAENPDASLRSRALCGLLIGQGFHLASPGSLEGGRLYDPKTGKTYSGVLTASGRELNLRGYVGIRLFGRSETWTRATAPGQCTR